MMGENVAQADSAEAAHQGLMESPGHRANMLNPKFTHVGIGVAPRANDREPLVATLVFGRRPRAPAVPSQAAAIEAIAALRRAKGVSQITIDPVLQAGAEAGAQTLAGDAAASPDDAIAASGKAVAREASRRRVGRGAGCATVIEVLELEQLAEYPLFVRSDLRRVGIAVTARANGKTTLLMLIVLTEGQGNCSAGK
jgi:cysteine-rich secretory family protein